MSVKTPLAKALRRLVFRKEIAATKGQAGTDMVAKIKEVAGKLDMTANSLGDGWIINGTYAYKNAALLYLQVTGEQWVEPSGLAALKDKLTK